jgi:hypothetical protein
MRKITKRSAAVIGATVVAIGGGAAWAASTDWFNGTGDVTASSSDVKQVTATASVTDALWPKHSVDATLSIGNYNSYPVTATGIASGTLSVSAYDNAAAATAGTLSQTCNGDQADISLGTFSPQDVGAGAWATPTFSKFVTMGADAPLSCSNKVFKIHFTMTGDIQPDA